MKRIRSLLSALALGLVLFPVAHADVLYEEPVDPTAKGFAERFWPLILLVLALLIVTALLVRHFTRKK